MKPEISRKQAWCKLAILIAEGLPDPQEIGFNPLDNRLLTIDVNSVESIDVWQSALALAHRISPLLMNDRTGWIHEAYGHWRGYDVRVACVVPSADVEPVDEDMSAVKALAEPTCVCCNPGDCGDRRGHIEIVGVENTEFGPENYDRCNCGRDWPCEKASA